MTPLRFEVKPDTGHTLLALSAPEYLDSQELDRFTDELLQAIDGLSAPKLVLDLAAVQYVASAMLGLLVNVRQRINSRRGKLVLTALPRRLDEVIHATTMGRLFVITRTHDEAKKLIG